MRVAIVSDAHLAEAGSARQRDFVRWVDSLEADRLVLLGDIFHAWWGWREVVPAGVVPACAALLRARERGVAIDLVPGNHDFAVGGWLRDVAGVTVAPTLTLEVGAARVHLAHGDAADRSLGYRALTRVLRGRLFAGGLRLAGPDRGQRWLTRLAGDPGRPHMPAADLVAAQEAWAAAKLADDIVHAVVQGHSHALSLREVAGGVSVLSGAWAHLRSHVRLCPGRVALCRGDTVVAEAALP